MVGEHRDCLSNVISALVTKKLVCKGCEAYLAYILNTKASESTMEKIHTVREFSDVFLEELLRLLSECEAEFGIDLLLAIALVFIASYRMSPKKLVEIKAQL